MPEGPHTHTETGWPRSAMAKASDRKARSRLRPTSGTPSTGRAMVIDDGAGARPPEERQQILGGRPDGALARHERHAQPNQVVRQAGAAGCRETAAPARSCRTAAGSRAAERQPAGERLVEQRAHRVPVAGRPVHDRPAHCSGDMYSTVPAMPSSTVFRRRRRHDLGGDPEVEDHDPPFRESPGRSAGLRSRWTIGPRAARPPLDQLPKRRHAAADVEHADGRSRPARAYPRTCGRAASTSTSALTAVRRSRIRIPGRTWLDEVLSRHQFHREEPDVALGDELVELHEIAVRDVGESAEFLLEAVDGGGIGPTQRLEGERLPPAGIADLIDGPHAAGAELTLDRVATRECGAKIFELAAHRGTLPSERASTDRPLRSRARCSRSEPGGHVGTRGQSAYWPPLRRSSYAVTPAKMPRRRPRRQTRQLRDAASPPTTPTNRPRSTSKA